MDFKQMIRNSSIIMFTVLFLGAVSAFSQWTRTTSSPYRTYLTNAVDSVGIGVASSYTPPYKVVILGNPGKGINGTANENAVLQLIDRAHTGTGSPLPQVGISFGGRYDGSLTTTNFASFSSIQGGKANNTASNYAGFLNFFTRENVSPFNFVERMRIDAAGYVGIGTTAPTARLEINPTLTGTAPATIVGQKIGINQASYGFTTWTGIYVATPSGSGQITNKYALVTEPNAGNVGIGTTTPDPSAKLEINGQIKITGGGPTADGYVLTSDANGLARWAASYSGSSNHLDAYGGTPANVVWVDNAGKVGIGTTTPSSFLDVNKSGTGSSNGTYRFLQPSLGNLGNGTPGDGHNSILFGKNETYGGLISFEFLARGNNRIRFKHSGEDDSLSMVLEQRTGYVGIGKEPITVLDVQKSGSESTYGTFRFLQPHLGDLGGGTSGDGNNSILFGKNETYGGLISYEFLVRGNNRIRFKHSGEDDSLSMVLEQRTGYVGIGKEPVTVLDAMPFGNYSTFLLHGIIFQ